MCTFARGTVGAAPAAMAIPKSMPWNFQFVTIGSREKIPHILCRESLYVIAIYTINMSILLYIYSENTKYKIFYSKDYYWDYVYMYFILILYSYIYIHIISMYTYLHIIWDTIKMCIAFRWLYIMIIIIIAYNIYTHYTYTYYTYIQKYKYVVGAERKSQYTLIYL